MSIIYRVSYQSKQYPKKRAITLKWWKKKSKAQEYADSLNKYYKRNARVIKDKTRKKSKKKYAKP
jgi:hypothetical protein